MDFIPIINQIPIFNILTSEEKVVLNSLVELDEYGVNQPIFNGRCDKVYFLISGMVKVQAIASGDVLKVLYFHEAGEFCTEVFSFLTGQKSNYKFVAVQPVKAMTITKPKMDYICDNYFNFLKCRSVWLENYCMKLTQDLEKFHFMTPEERYENLLNVKPHLFQMLSNKDIASIIGITPESFSRMLHRILKGNKQ